MRYQTQHLGYLGFMPCYCCGDTANPCHIQKTFPSSSLIKYLQRGVGNSVSVHMLSHLIPVGITTHTSQMDLGLRTMSLQWMQSVGDLWPFGQHWFAWRESATGKQTQSRDRTGSVSEFLVAVVLKPSCIGCPWGGGGT